TGERAAGGVGAERPQAPDATTTRAPSEGAVSKAREARDGARRVRRPPARRSPGTGWLYQGPPLRVEFLLLALVASRP
ncbi:MAG: hypothetical protein ACRENE_28450, partial [Polyangiaceae bacterium]